MLEPLERDLCKAGTCEAVVHQQGIQEMINIRAGKMESKKSSVGQSLKAYRQ